MNLTEEQKKAITLRGTNILVSAAAGSGKTGVLSKRVLDHLEHGDSIDELLVLTFTRAAAGEMRKRIRDGINDAYQHADGEKRQFYHQQQVLLGDAPILTIHSFCLRLLRRHANLIPDLDPQFTIADDKKIKALRDKLLDEYLEECYTSDASEDNKSNTESGDSGLTGNQMPYYKLLRLLGSRMGDDGLKDALLEFIKIGIVQGNPEEWLKTIPDIFGEEELWKKRALEYADELIKIIIESSEKDFAASEQYCYAISETLRNDITSLKNLRSSLTWESINEFKFETKVRKKKDDDPDIDDLMTIARNGRKKLFKDNILSIFKTPYDVYAGQIRELKPEMETFCRMALEFYQRFRAEKLKHNMVGLEDLELLVASLLRNNSDVSEHYKRFFKEVLIDEYQDVNPLQNEIVSGLAGDNKLFAVGDVKQSIYGFRYADHKLFTDLQRKYNSDSGKGQVIYLNKNFRSRGEVLQSVNGIFCAIMNPAVSEIAYGKDEMLYLGNDSLTPDALYKTEFLVVPESQEKYKVGESSRERQGRLIAQKIIELKEKQFPVREGNTERPLEYRDIVILIRSANAHGTEIASGLIAAGIPVRVPGNNGFLRGYECLFLKSFLDVLDNPIQDIPLSTLLKSPFFKFDENDLLLLARKGDGRSLWEKLSRCREKLPECELLDKCRNFYKEIQKRREQSRFLDVDELVNSIIKDYDLIPYFAGYNQGAQRIKALELFYRESINFCQNEQRGLFDFLRYLEHLIESNSDEFPEDDDSFDGVRIMSIHKSKGLEFPVVFLADTGHIYNNQDSRKRILFHKEYGLGPEYYDFKNRFHCKTLPKILINKEMQRLNHSEEMRLLYVAMTRAKDKLFLIGSDKDSANETLEEKIRYCCTPMPCQSQTLLSSALLMSVNSYYKLLLESLKTPLNRKGVIDVRIENIGETQVVSEETADKSVSHFPEDAEERLKRSLERKLPVAVPSKITVTGLLPLYEKQIPEQNLITPDFITDKKVSASELGTIFHMLMEKIPLDKEWDTASLRAFAGTLLEKDSNITVEDFDIPAALTFLNSDIGIALRNSGKVKREMDFIGGFKRDELFEPDANLPSGSVLLQGTIDLIFMDSNGHWILVDYKTSDISRQGREAFLNRYTRQMDLYKLALKRIYNIDVSRALFYMTKTREFIEV